MIYKATDLADVRHVSIVNGDRRRHQGELNVVREKTAMS